MTDRTERFHRMNKIKDALKERHLTFSELQALVYDGSVSPRVSTRTLLYDLEGLRILGDVFLGDDGFYYSREGNRKEVYQYIQDLDEFRSILNSVFEEHQETVERIVNFKRVLDSQDSSRTE